jgi:hypothetical protein
MVSWIFSINTNHVLPTTSIEHWNFFNSRSQQLPPLFLWLLLKNINFLDSSQIVSFTTNCKNVVRFEKTRLPLTANCKNVVRFDKKTHVSLFSSSFTNKTKKIIQLSPMFSIEWYYFLKIWFCLKWYFPRSQSSKRTTFLQCAVSLLFFFRTQNNIYYLLDSNVFYWMILFFENLVLFEMRFFKVPKFEVDNIFAICCIERGNIICLNRGLYWKVTCFFVLLYF